MKKSKKKMSEIKIVQYVVSDKSCMEIVELVGTIRNNISRWSNRRCWWSWKSSTFRIYFLIKCHILWSWTRDVTEDDMFIKKPPLQ